MLAKFLKKALTLLTAAIITMLCCVCAFSAQADTENKATDSGYQFLDETVQIEDGEVFVAQYNLTENCSCHVSFIDNNGGGYEFAAQNMMSDTLVYHVGDKKLYCYVGSMYGSIGPKDYRTFCFNNSGAVYQKVRFKLSNNPYFNEDGSHTYDGLDYYFGEDFVIDRDVYSSALVFISGGAISMVAPDEDGYVEIYVSTEIDVLTEFFTSYSYRLYGEGDDYENYSRGDIYAQRENSFVKGSLTGGEIVRINDATKIQQYLAQQIAFDDVQKFRADVDLNDNINILDVTKIQWHIAKR